MRASTAIHSGNALIAAMLMSVLAQAAPCDDLVTVTRLRPDAAAYTLSSGIDEAGQFVVRNSDDWAALWQRVHSRMRPVPPLPEVDFERETMIVAAAGQRRTGGYSIRIDRAWREGTATIIVVHAETPGSGCIVANAFTSAVDIARLPVTPGPIEFRLESVARACD
ncbi:MAG: protease complex subunit PrcB family protein [Gammaproteobacteria bacterium]|nr:protease complex subunit PrcB family protein [Gammaproteobacteria bacterium]